MDGLFAGNSIYKWMILGYPYGLGKFHIIITILFSLYYYHHIITINIIIIILIIIISFNRTISILSG